MKLLKDSIDKKTEDDISIFLKADVIVKSDIRVVI